MSRKIEKKLRETANKDHQEILDSNKLFLSDVLLPKFEVKRIIALEEQKKVRGIRIKRFACIAASLVIVVFTLSMFWIFSSPDDKPENHYFGPFDTISSDLASVNECLIKTEMSGNIETIIRSSHPETKKTMFFTIFHEIVGDAAIIQSNIELIIERSLNCDSKINNYNNHLNFLGYEIKFNESKTQETYEESYLLEININAYFDTGKERYFITYYEITVNEASSFENYLASIIQTK